MRFAFQALQALKPIVRSPIGQAVLPQSGLELAMSVVPNLAFAGMTALNQPQGTSPLVAAGAGAEDLIGSLALQTLGRGLGSAGAGGVRRLRGGSLPNEWESGVKGLSEYGAEFLGYGLVPRPFATKAYQDYEQRVTQEQQDEQAAREKEIRDRILAQAGIRGLILPQDLQEWSLGAGSMSPEGGFG